MALCNHEYRYKNLSCPNEEHSQGKCLLHYYGGERIPNSLYKQYDLEIENIIRSSKNEVIFDGINFPKDKNIRIPALPDKKLKFINCKFNGDLKFPPGNKYKSIIIIGGSTHYPINIRNIKIDGAIKFINTIFNQSLDIQKIQGGFTFHLLLNNSNIMNFNDIDFVNGFYIRSRMENQSINFHKIKTPKQSRLIIDSCQNSFRFQNCEFLARTDIIADYIPKNQSIYFELTDCFIDNLYCRDIDLNDSRVSIIRPKLCEKHKTIRKRFKSFYRRKNTKLWERKKAYRDQELHNFVRFLRRAKDYFFNSTENVEIYDNFYKLNLFFSRMKSDYKWQDRITNNLARWFSDYGYSIWRPLIWLLSILFIFNWIYLLNIYEFNVSGNTGLFDAFLNTACHHLSQISIFRGSDPWFPPGSLNRVIMILEAIVIIPIITSFIMSIRKVFKRV